MRIIFASGRDYLPDRVDGATISIHALLRRLQAKGHECEALVGIDFRHRVRTSVYRARRFLTRRRTPGWADGKNGYPTYRAWDVLVPALVRRRIADKRPDLVVTQLEQCEPIAAAAIELGVPTLLYVHDAEFNWRGDMALDNALLQLVSCSHFVATRVRERLGFGTPVLYPIVEPSWYALPGLQRGAYVTMVNPMPQKGVDVAIQVARLLPHRRFMFVETWPLSPGERASLADRLPGNASLRESTLDMRSVYGDTAVLLAPSQWEEAFGRVIIEAQASGIPVVASTRGGIPEVLQSGGRLLDASDPPERWAAAIEDILHNPSVYTTLSDGARSNSTRAVFDPEAIVSRFLEIAAELREGVDA